MKLNLFSKKNKSLLRALVVTDFKLRYQGSVLGYAWSLIKPLFLFAIMYLVFGLIIKIGTIEHYAVYLLLGVILWTFFTESTQQGMNSIINRSDLLRKISLPKFIIVLSATFSALINLFLNLIIVLILIMINGVELNYTALLFPLYILEIYFLSLGLAYLLAALNVKYRDTGHIWEIIMQAAFYATPILYPLSVISDKSDFIAKIILLNPVAQSIQDMRYILITKDTATLSVVYDNFAIVLVPITITILIAFVGSVYFRKSSRYFAERI